MRNRLLAALPFIDYEALEPHLESVYFEQRAVLVEPDEQVRYVYFPETLVVSLSSRLRGGDTTEVVTAGNEGMVGLSLFLGDLTSSTSAVVQIAGNAVRIDADVFAQLAGSPGTLHQVLLRYTQALLIQIAQGASCNRTHLVEERCARWLLMTHDRVSSLEFPIAHEFLALMLGVRRAGVSLALRRLQDADIIDCTRGSVEILDHARLEDASCECYRVVRSRMEQLLPRSA